LGHGVFLGLGDLFRDQIHRLLLAPHLVENAVVVAHFERAFLAENHPPLAVFKLRHFARVQIELAVVEVHVVLVYVFDAEAVHHLGTGRDRLGQVLFAVAIGRDRTAARHPVADVDIVDGVLDNQVAGGFHVVVPGRTQALLVAAVGALGARFGGRAVALRLDHE
jgi:hypothetical protein